MITVKNIVEKLSLTVAAGNELLDREITGGYICDMLSLAMARVKCGDAWITIQTNQNVVAVASLSDCACVIIPESFPVEKETLDRAREKDVVILQSSKTAFALAKELGDLI